MGPELLGNPRCNLGLLFGVNVWDGFFISPHNGFVQGASGCGTRGSGLVKKVGFGQRLGLVVFSSLHDSVKSEHQWEEF